jgi:hypothetical protein
LSCCGVCGSCCCVCGRSLPSGMVVSHLASLASNSRRW